MLNLMVTKIRIRLYTTLVIVSMLVSFSEVAALGTSAEGWAIVQLVKLESAGLIYKSFEGSIRVATFEKDRSCGPTESKCYPPKLETINFSIDEGNVEVARFMNRNIGKQMVVQYRIHRVEPISLRTSFEILDAQPQVNDLPEGMPRLFAIGKSGSKRNFTMYGRFLRLEYRGLSLKTYEGIFYDKQRNQIHPFSLTDDNMAKYIFNTLKITKMHYFGISEARVTVSRETPYDIFEVNFDRRPETI